jgi:ribosomal protein L16 Arg81 hydroxylase
MTKLNLQSISREEGISGESFQRSYLKSLQPVIIKDLSASWPAMNKWSPEYLKEKYGEKPVKVYNANFAKQGKSYMSNVDVIPFKEFIDLVSQRSMDLRMFLHNLKTQMPELLEDIQIPSIASGISRNLIFMFFGCKGSFTPMHFDIDMAHVFHTPIYGRKRVTLFPIEESKNLYKHPFACRSYVDVDNPDFNRFPRLKNAQGYQDTLQPGETLFIPGGYWHHIAYNESGCSVSLRCPHQSLLARVQGYVNLGVLMPIDRIMNKCFSESWFRWKENQSFN